MQTDDRHDSTEIEPMVPMMPTDRSLPDGGERRGGSQTPTARRSDGGDPSRRFDRPVDTSYASEYTRDDEEIEPFVADLR